MAVFRKMQSNSYLINQFIELPKYFWMGTMLFDKYTLEPISTYNTATLPIYENTAVLPNMTSGIICNTNMVLGQFGILKSGLVNYRCIPTTNEVNNIPKTYIIDSMDDQYVYFVYTEYNVARSKQLIKWDMKTHSAVWNVFVHGSNAGTVSGTPVSFVANFPQWNMIYWKQDANHLYFIADAIPSSNPAGTSYPYSFFFLQKRIIKILKNTGAVVSGFPSFTLFEDKVPRTVAAGFTTNHVGSLSLSSCLIPVDRNPTDSSTLMFSCVLDSNRLGLEIVGASPHSYFWRAGFTTFNSLNGIFTTVGNVYISEGSVHIPINASTLGNIYTLGAVIHAPRASQLDTDIRDNYVVYMCWGNIITMNTAPNTSTDVRAVHSFTYIPSINRTIVKKMTMLNTDGQPITKADWKFTTASIISQPYIIRGSGKKYLMIYDAVNQPSISADIAEVKTYLFEFIDADTLQLRDSIPFNVTDLMWLTDTTFVGGTSTCIYVYKINTETGRFIIDKTLTPEFAVGSYDVICIDDMFNLWYSERTPDIGGSLSAYQWNYLNSYTMSQIILTPEQTEYTYVSTNLTTYVDVAVYNDSNEILAKSLIVTLIGPAKFESNNLKSIEVTTVIDVATRIPVVITGVGEITYHAEIVQ